MKRARWFAAISLFASATVVAACHGSGTYVPGQGSATSAQLPAPAVTVPRDIADRLGLPPNTTIPACSAPTATLPGSYTLFIGSGNVKSGTFTSVASASFWEFAKYTRATPPPSSSPSPTSSPTTGPTPPPEYFYYGTYALKKGVGGCAYLITTKSGKPFQGSKYNGESLGFPNVKASYFHTKLIAEGPATIKVGPLSASGGNGTVLLKTMAGTTYNSGSIHLIGRILF